MAIGIYRAFKRKSEVSSVDPGAFINNIQVWFSIFAFSASAVGILLAVWGWVMLGELSPFIFGCLGVLSIFVVAFFVIAGLSLIKLVTMLWHGCKGIPYKFDPDMTPANVLRAISPINKVTNPSEYKKILIRLIKEKDKLIKERAELVAEYSEIMQQMEERDDKPRAT